MKRAVYTYSGRIFYSLFFLWLFCLPLFRGVVHEVEQALFSLGAVVLVLLYSCRERLKSGVWFQWLDSVKHFVYPAFVLLVLLLLHTFFVSSFPVRSFSGWLNFASYFLVYVLGLSAFQRKKRKEQLFRFFTFTAVFYSLHGLFCYLGWLEHGWWEKQWFLSGSYVNHNHFAGFLELLLFFLIGRILAKRSSGDSLIQFLFLIPIWMAFLLSLSRGGWISFFLTFTLGGLILTTGDKALRPLGAKILGILVGLGIGFFVFVNSGINPHLKERFDTFFKAEGQYEFMDFRLRLWNSTAHAISERPVLGYGLKSFLWEMKPFRPENFPYKFDFAHNDWLQFPMEMGFLLFLCFFFFLIKHLYFWFLSFNRRDLDYFRFEKLGLGLGIVCILFHSVTDFNLQIFGNAVWFVLFCSQLTEVNKE